jgi:hypothetical protein
MIRWCSTGALRKSTRDDHEWKQIHLNKDAGKVVPVSINHAV